MADYPRKCILDGSRGIYIPQDFANGFDFDDGRCVPDTWRGITAEQRDILNAGPDHEHYWEVWAEVSDSAYLIDSDGIEWRLWQDGDLFAVPADADEWNNDVFTDYFRKREEWNMEYVQSDDYVGDYAYLMSESNRINESVLRLLTKCSSFYDGPRLLHRQATLIADDIASTIYHDDLFEHEVCDEYSSESYGYLDSFQIGEHEDQVCVRDLYKEIGDNVICGDDGLRGFCDALETWMESQRDFCLRGWSSNPLRNQDYPTVYLITYTGLRVDYVVREETLREVVAERIVELCSRPPNRNG